MSNSLHEAIERVKAGGSKQADIQAIAAAVQSGHLVLVEGQGAVGVGGDVSQSSIVLGSKNVTGDRNIVIYGASAQAIQAVLAQHTGSEQSADTASVDELVQKVRSQASAKILDIFSKIQLLNKRQVEVDQLYVDVYVLEKQEFQSTIPELLKGRNIQKQFDQLGIGERGERLQGLAIAASKQYPRLMVLGKPGSGKTTFLKHLAVSCAKGKFLDNYIPFLLELRDIDEADFCLFQCVHRELELDQEAKTKQILNQGRVLILLDGLDEVPNSLRQMVQDKLRKFVKQYWRNRFILTCRTQATEYIPEQFLPVEVAPFNPEQVECFASHWFAAMVETPEQGVAMKEHFIEKLYENPQTAKLAVTPVLVSLACWIFDDLKCLPEKRSDLYCKGLDLLLQQWDEGRGMERDSGSDRYEQLTTEERKQLLSYLAVRKFEQANNFVLFEESEICSYIEQYLSISAEESKAVLQTIAEQHGLLIKRAHKIWSFSHLTFQEYLVANFFYNQSDFKSLIEHATDYRWREIFLLASEMIVNRIDLFLEIQQSANHIIAKDQLVQNILAWINEKASSIGFEIFLCKQLYNQIEIQRQVLSEAILTEGNDKIQLDIKLFTPDNSQHKLNYRQQALLRGFCLDLIYNYSFEDSIIGDAKIISQLNLYMSFKRKDEIVDSVIILDYSLSWLFAYLKIASPFFLFDHTYDALTQALRQCATQCEVLMLMNIVSTHLFDKVLSLLQGFLSVTAFSPAALSTWWKDKGISLAEQLREVSVKERNICHDQNFPEESKELFEKYYVANRLLAECMNNTPNLDHSLSEEICSNFLLPNIQMS